MTAPGRQHARRVVITGLGAVTNLGGDAKSTWHSMIAGRSGITTIQDPLFANYADGNWPVKIAGEMFGWTPEGVIPPHEARRLDRTTQLGLAAAHEAIHASGIDFENCDRERCGAIIGSGVGGISTIEDSVRVLENKGPKRVNPFTVPRLMVNAVAGNVSIRYGLHGPASAHATACASAGHAIGDALETIRRGRADVMVTGGAEAAVTPLCLASFMTMKALSTRNDDPEAASRPFDRDRDGFVLSEGAGMMILESEEHAKARGAPILAELLGAANSCDGSHITAPDPEGRGAGRSMKWALEDAGLEPETIDYINAHGTSTPLGDAAEVAAVMSVFGDHARASAGGQLVMSSTKSMHGHTLGASGAVETVACVNAIREGIIPPTINLHAPDESFDIDLVPHESRQRPVRHVMNNTFGFGGHNVTLVIGQYDG